MNLLGAPLEFYLFGLTLLGVAVFHRRTLEVALIGLGAILIYQGVWGVFPSGQGLGALGQHALHEWVILTNILLLLVGFGLLSNQFELSGLPDHLPGVLPDNWLGGLAMLAIVFVLSAFLDNIAAAIIGGTVAANVFSGRVHIGYLAAIVGASNAGGSGSVVGDTTTTMMWIDGVDPLAVLPAYLAASVALMVFGIPAALQQHRHQPILADALPGTRIDWVCVAIVMAILVAAIGTNVLVNLYHPDLADQVPSIGLAVWAAIALAALLRRPDWAVVPEAAKGALFLLSLVLCASMMPVEHLPVASWQTALGLGFVSSVFDNIPLTKLALEQGGYDWGFVAFAVGFGGSMVWFGSTAGVALSNQFAETRSVFSWIRHGWHVALAYVVGFAVMLAVLGWHPHEPHKRSAVEIRALCCADAGLKPADRALLS